MDGKKVILLTAGGTGGHFFPALALAEEFCLDSALEIHFSTDNRCKKYITDEKKINFHIIDLYINLRGTINKLKLPFVILISIIKSCKLILRLKPSIIIGFGGYPSFPIMFVGQMLSIPTIIYEQNSFLGKSNKIFARKAKLIALAYNNTSNLPTKYLNKSIVTGDIIRNNIKTLKQKNNFDSNPFNLLIMGGSQGAKFFSTFIPLTIKILLIKYPGTKINIIQQVAKEDQAAVIKIYEELKIQNIIAEFFHDIHQHYERANLVIARSGATTIAELTQIGLPAIFIPFPYAADDHQYYNAKTLYDMNSSWFYRQENADSEILADKLHALINDPSLIREASLNLLKRKTDGTKHLVNTVLKIIT